MFAVLVLVGVRTVAVSGSLLSAGLTRSELAVAAWFGPKGFASAVYGLLVLSSGIPLGPAIFHIVVLVITLSVFAHSTTDHLVSEWFKKRRREPEGGDSGREQDLNEAGGRRERSER